MNRFLSVTYRFNFPYSIFSCHRTYKIFLFLFFQYVSFAAHWRMHAHIEECFATHVQDVLLLVDVKHILPPRVHMFLLSNGSLPPLLEFSLSLFPYAQQYPLDEHLYTYICLSLVFSVAFKKLLLLYIQHLHFAIYIFNLCLFMHVMFIQIFNWPCAWFS